MKNIWKVILILALLVSIAGCSATEEAPSLAKTAPDFQLRDLEGNLVSLTDFRGQTVLLNFWATWCGPCVEEMPFIQKAHDELSQRGVTVLTVNIGENPDHVRDFMRTFNYSFLVLVDQDAAVARKYRVTGIPTTFIIDPEGIIKDIKISPFSDFTEISERIARITP